MGKQAVLPVKATLNKSGFSAGLKAMKSEAAGFARGIAGGLKTAITSPIAAIGGALAGVFTVGLFAHGIKGALDLGGSMEDLKARTGETADKLLVFQQVLKDNGVDSAETGEILNKMSKSIIKAADDTTGAVTAFDRLGLSVDGLRARSPVEQFRAIGAALQKIQDPARKSALAMEVFGKSGGSLLSALGDVEGFEAAAQSIGRQAQLLAANSALFDKISDRLGRAGLKLQGFFVGVASNLAPMLDALTARFDKLDFSGLGEKVGKGLIDATNVITGLFQNPKKITEGLGLALEGTFKSAANFFSAALRAAFVGVFQKSTWVAFNNAIVGIGDMMAGALINAMQKATAYLYAGIEKAMEMLPESLGGTKNQAATHHEAATQMYQRANEEDFRAVDAGQEYAKTGDADAWIRQQKHKANALKIMQQARAEDELAKPESISDRVNRIMKSGELGKNAAGLTKAGRDAMESAMTALGDSLKAGISAFKVDDLFGAAQAWQKLGVVLDKARVAGEKTAQAFADAANTQKQGPAQYHDSYQHLRGFRSFREGVGVYSGGVQGAPAWSPGSSHLLFSAKERRQMMDDYVSAGGQRSASSAGAYHAVRAGDHKRQIQHAKDVALGKTGVEKTNALLEQIIKPINTTATTLQSWDHR